MDATRKAPLQEVFFATAEESCFVEMLANGTAASLGSASEDVGGWDSWWSKAAARRIRRKYIQTIADAKRTRKTQSVIWNGVIPKPMAADPVEVDESSRFLSGSKLVGTLNDPKAMESAGAIRVDAKLIGAFQGCAEPGVTGR